MTIDTVKTVATRFLTSQTFEVLVLKGAWGVGKTYAWDALVKQHKNEIKFANYCYVSLFGVSSITELRTAIFAKTKSVRLIGEKLDAKSVNNEWAKLSWEGLKSVGHRLSAFKDVPYMKNISIGFEALAPHLIRNTIICLDDFERLNPSLIKHEELLGFISELKVEKECKIVLIFNEDKLKSKDVYKEYREKVVDIELLFAPTAYEACELALPPNTPCREEISKYAISLGITNIRILRKIFKLTEIIYKDVSKFHVGVMEQAVMTLVLLIWCYYDTDETKPTIEFIIEWNRMAWGFNEGKGKEKDPTHTAWANTLRDYGLMHMDEFDQTIIKVIQRGYLEETGFSEEAIKLDATLRANELEQSFTQAWRLFHDTFSDNQAELIKALAESFKKSVQHISLINLNGTVRLLRQLGSSDIADELIDVFVCNHANEAKLFDLTDYPFADDITDPVILERFKEQHSKCEATLPLIEAVKYMATNNSFSIEHTNALKKATKDEFFKLFKLEHGELLGSMVKSCLQFERWSDENKFIAEKACAALVRIGKENQLNAIRVRRYGITNEHSENISNPQSE